MAGRGVNKVILIGHLGRDPETRYLPSGGAVCSFSVATTESWKDKQTGQMQERTEWHRVVMFNRLAEIAAEYLRKGSKVYLEGSLQTRKWQDNTGQDRWTTEIVAREMQMLESRGSMGQEPPMPPLPEQQSQPFADAYAPPSASSPKQQPATAVAEAATEGSSGGRSNQFDDDIPF